MADNNARRRWKKSDIALENQKKYLEKNRYPITFIHLLYIANFKGGNGTINEDESVVNNKLIQFYEHYFKKIEPKFGSANLHELPEQSINSLIEIWTDIFKLSEKPESHIDGFNISRLSALLHSYFPKLIPIIDRKVLFGAELLTIKNYNKTTEQVKWLLVLESFIRKMAIETNQLKNIREMDEEWFSVKFDNDQIN